MLVEDDLPIPNERLPSIHEQELVEVDQGEGKLSEWFNIAAAWPGDELPGQAHLLPAWFTLEQQAVHSPDGLAGRRRAGLAPPGKGLGHRQRESRS